jgi:hypothetical protein
MASATGDERIIAVTVDNGDSIPDVAVSVIPARNGVTVSWSDGMETWAQQFASLSAGIAYAGLVARCGEDGWGRFATVDAEQFAVALEQFWDTVSG